MNVNLDAETCGKQSRGEQLLKLKVSDFFKK